MTTTTRDAPATVGAPRVHARETTQSRSLAQRIAPVAALCFAISAIPNAAVLYHMWDGNDVRTMWIMLPHAIVSTAVIAALLAATIVFDEAE